MTLSLRRPQVGDSSALRSGRARTPRRAPLRAGQGQAAGPHVPQLAVIIRQVATATNVPAHYKLIRFNYLFTSNILEIRRVNKI